MSNAKEAAKEAITAAIIAAKVAAEAAEKANKAMQTALEAVMTLRKEGGNCQRSKGAAEYACAGFELVDRRAQEAYARAQSFNFAFNEDNAA